MVKKILCQGVRNINGGCAALTHPTMRVAFCRAGKQSAPASHLLTYQVSEFVPFATMSSLYRRFPHANVQRGLAAAPFAIPAPGRKSPLRGSLALFPPAAGRARQYLPVLSCPRTGSLRCAPACGETARPIFFSRSKTINISVIFL